MSIYKSSEDLSKEFEHIFKLFDDPEGICIAGGSVLSAYARKTAGLEIPFNDYDLYFVDKNLFEKTVSKIQENPNVKSSHVGSNSVSFHCYDSFYVDLIARYNGSPTEIISEFDIDICMAAIDSAGQLYLHEDMDEMLESKVVSLVNIPEERTRINQTGKRFIKYIEKGFEFDDESMIIMIKLLAFGKPEVSAMNSMRGQAS